MFDRKELLENFTHCPDSGLIFWRPRDRSYFKTEKGYLGWNKKWAGRAAFNTPITIGYLMGSFNGKKDYAHRVIFLMEHGYLPDEVDHINGNKKDNRICNLRPVSRIENAHNLGRSKKNKTGTTGVFKIKRTGHYTAEICVNWERIYLGYFRTMQEAVAARKEAEIRYGYHANHGKMPARR